MENGHDMNDIHADQRLEAICRAYEIQIGLLKATIETYKASMFRILASLEDK